MLVRYLSLVGIAVVGGWLASALGAAADFYQLETAPTHWLAWLGLALATWLCAASAISYLDKFRRRNCPLERLGWAIAFFIGLTLFVDEIVRPVRPDWPAAYIGLMVLAFLPMALEFARTLVPLRRHLAEERAYARKQTLVRNCTEQRGSW